MTEVTLVVVPEEVKTNYLWSSLSGLFKLRIALSLVIMIDIIEEHFGHCMVLAHLFLFAAASVGCYTSRQFLQKKLDISSYRQNLHWALLHFKQKYISSIMNFLLQGQM